MRNMLKKFVIFGAAFFAVAACSSGSETRDSAAADSLDKAGLLRHGVATVGVGGIDRNDAKLQSALCNYVVGRADDVVDTAQLPDATVLADGSTVEDLGHGIRGLDCFYETPGNPDKIVFVVSVMNKAGGLKADHMVSRHVGDNYVMVGYGSNYDGTIADTSALQDLAAQAGERFRLKD